MHFEDLISPNEIIYDLDNLRLENVKENLVFAQFELQYLLIEGHCFEVAQKMITRHPRGLEVVLGTAQKPHMQDTLVMSNLGYFILRFVLLFVLVRTKIWF